MMKIGDVLKDKHGGEAPKKYWCGEIGPEDDFGAPIVDEFIDGKIANGQWANMAPSSWRMYGLGKLGTGWGQRYEKQEDGRWLKVEG